MAFRVLLCVFCVFMPTHHVMASQAVGGIGVSIISPTTLDLKSLKKLCKAEPETMACALYEERKLDRTTNKKKSYSVYTANFQ